MAYPENNCLADYGVCLMRISQLNDEGDFVSTPLNTYVFDPPVQIQANPVTSDVAAVEQRNGCGDVCASKPAISTLTGWTLDTEWCEWEVAGLNLLLETLPILDDDDNIIGWADQDPTSGTAQNGVCVEFWTKPWNGQAQEINPDTGELVYRRFVYPRVTWIPGQRTHQDGFTVYPATGTASSSNAVNFGPDGNWPKNLNGIPSANWTEDATELPSAECELTTNSPVS